jgi:iron complex transport system ATP-binding protein
MSALAAIGLDVRLGRRDVLAGIDLAIAARSLVGLIGPNGAGKTTLIRALLSLVAPTRGRVTLDGREVAAMPAPERARAMAYLPQGADVAWPLAVADVVALGRLPFGGARDASEDEAVERALAATGISELRARRAGTLSGGERARVMLARALAGEPRVLLADEPVAALDPYHQLAVMELLAERARLGASIVVVLHDLNLAARFCDRLVLLDRGRIVGDGVPEAVLTEASLAETYQVTAAMGRHDGVLTVLPWRRLPDAAGRSAP